MSRPVERVSGGLLRVAEDGMIDFSRLDSGTAHRLFAGNGGQLHGRKVAQLAAITPHRRARAVHNGNIICLKHENNILQTKLSALDSRSQSARSKLLSVSEGCVKNRMGNASIRRAGSLCER